MNSTNFINRTRELAFFEDRYKHKNAQLLIFYGRRRVGKTSLLLQFCKNKQYVYLLADLKPEKEQIRDFSLQIANQFEDAVLKQQPLETADALFAYLERLWKEKRVVVVFDEYPYLCKLNPAFSSILQKHWDSHLSKTHAFLILCGSS
ncbi:MAG: ATP-binding protein, partial [Nanoarchaeota archaeon]